MRPGTDPAVLSRRMPTREGLESRHEKAKFYFVLRGIRARVVVGGNRNRTLHDET